MSQVSRPMQIALAATLLLFAVWFVALRPKPAGEGEAPAPAPAEQPASSSAAPGVDGLSGAVEKAQDAVTNANGGGNGATQSGDAPARSSRAGGGISTKPIHTDSPVASVRTALRMNKAIAIAFVDSATADSRAVDRELLHVSRFGGRAFTLSVPLAHVADYAFITSTVEVTVAPTVVIVDPQRRATTIVGATDRVEIEQRLADALTVKP
jgi:hypothetical protein